MFGNVHLSNDNLTLADVGTKAESMLELALRLRGDNASRSSVEPEKSQ
jgi:hypothetical protein